MAKIKYRASSTPTVPTTTTVKGTPLTNLEIDGNIKSIADQLDLLTTNTAITDDVTNTAFVFPMWAFGATASNGTGAVPYRISSTNLRYKPSTDTLYAANFSGNANTATLASTVTTNANLTGEVTSTGNSTIVPNATVIGKVLTGLSPGAGVVASTDTILQAINKLIGNDATNANLTGEVTSTGNATTVTNASVISKVLTGFASGSGTVAVTDTILQAINKLDGNIATKANNSSPALVTPTATSTPAVDNSSLLLATTAFVIGQAGSATPVSAAATAVVGTSTRFARQDHVHGSLAEPVFRAFRNTTTFALTSAAASVVLPFNGETFDSVSVFDSTTTFRWTPGVIGYYQLTGNVQVTGTALTAMTIELWMNAAAVYTKTVTGASVTSLTASITDLFKTTAVGDTFELRVTATGTTPVVAFGTNVTNFAGVLVSRG